MIFQPISRRRRYISRTPISGISCLRKIMRCQRMWSHQITCRIKVIIVTAGVISFLLYLLSPRWPSPVKWNSTLDDLLETDKCPACYGQSACEMFYNNQIHFSGISKLRMFDIINIQNVYFGNMDPDGREVVMKKLGTDSRHYYLDNVICEHFQLDPGCDLSHTLTHSRLSLPLPEKSASNRSMHGTPHIMFKCSTNRLLDRIVTYLKENKSEEVQVPDTTSILYSSLVNTEFLMLQTFPKSEGWPFPQYFGACGRVVVQEHAGRTLSHFVEASFQTRADIAYQLLKIAEELTTKSDFALYLTDVNYDNFAVDESGKVTIIDLEHIVVADKQTIQSEKPKDWNISYETVFTSCPEYQCLRDFDLSLCSRVNTDHNYHTICRDLLSHYAMDWLMPRGFLHDIPSDVEMNWSIGQLLEECVNPMQESGRWKAKDKLLIALKAIKDNQISTVPRDFGSKYHQNTKHYLSVSHTKSWSKSVSSSLQIKERKKVEF